MSERPVKWTNYTAFGSTMPGRSFTSSSYRYGFNGKENDPETSTQDYGMRIYNPSLGKFLSVDPLSKDYAYYTPYQFAGNKPIAAIDLDGLEDVYITTRKDRSEAMQIIYTDIHIRAMATKGTTPIPMRIYYNGDTKGTTQFEGPNRQNERAVFAVNSFTLNGAVCVSAETKEQTTTWLKSAIHIVPAPPPAPRINLPQPQTISAAEGVAKFSNASHAISGSDYKGDPAGPGALNQLFVNQLDGVINTVKANGTVKEINLTLTFSASPYAIINSVEISAKNGVENVKSYFESKGLNGIKINTSSKVVEESKEGNINTLEIKYK